MKSKEIQYARWASVPAQHRLPWQLLVNAILCPHIIIGLLALGCVLVYWSSILKHDQLPSRLALGLQSETAEATLDNVTTRTTRSGKGATRTVYAHSYHFTTKNGQGASGLSLSSSKHTQPTAAVEYYPSNPKINRLSGMQAEDDQQFLFFSVLSVVALVVTAYGALTSLRYCRVLRSGNLVVAKVIACRFKPPSRGTLQMMGIDIPLGSPNKVAEQEFPIEDFHSMVTQQWREMFDSRGRYMGTAAIRRQFIWLAGMMGAAFGAVIGSILTLVLSQQLNLTAVGRGALLGLCIGSPISALLEHFVKFLLRASKATLESIPPAYNQCPCILAVVDDSAALLRMPDARGFRIERAIDLKGDASDQVERHLFVSASAPRSTNSYFADELAVKCHALDADTASISIPFLKHKLVFVVLLIVGVGVGLWCI